MRLLVCGDRRWKDMELIFTVLTEIEKERLIRTVITGGCSGADDIVAEIAVRNARTVEVYDADWNEHGLAAGPIRNQEMLDKGKPDMVVGFHDDIAKSKGTKDMLKRSIAAGVPTMLVSHDKIVMW